MNTKTKEGARNKGNPYFLRVPWDKGGLVNTGPGSFQRRILTKYMRFTSTLLTTRLDLTNTSCWLLNEM